MKRFLVTVALGLACSVPAHAQDAPDITGTWTGDERAHVEDHAEAAHFTFVVTSQGGADFVADTTYTANGRSFSETVKGAIAPDGRSVFYANREGHAVGTLQSDSILDLCYIETGADAHVSCVRLTRQP